MTLPAPSQAPVAKARQLPPLPTLLLAGLLTTTGFFTWARLNHATGYPLDDAWIHQTYARNLALRGEWAFIPGHTSGGSTSPLWTLLLAPGHWLPGEGYKLWTLLLGALALGLTAWLGYQLVAQLLPGKPWAAWGTGGLLVLEWHLIWAAASGMETGLFALLMLAALAAMWERPLGAGVLVGLGIWTRPDGVIVLPFVLLGILLHTRDWRPALRAGMAAGMLAALYLGFNLAVSGEIWPTTFYAKQAEYTIQTELPLLRRLLSMAIPPLAGVGFALLPGWLLAGWTRRWRWLLPLGWALTYLLAYALRLPVTYQHGRYQMPVIPALLVSGWLGMAWFVQPQAAQMLRRVVGQVWVLSAGVILLGFYVIGAQAYTTDVQIIDEEMVAAAQWLADNVPPDELLAVHDIGAVGFYARRPILDLAGLVSPDVIPFIRDEAQLAAYIEAQGARYLMTFPGWYPELAADPGWEVVYLSAGTASLAAGGEQMVIYRWGGE